MKKHETEDQIISEPKPLPFKNDKLDKAIADFEDETSNAPFSERFSNLRWAFMDNVFNTIKTIKKYGVKSPISENAKYVQEEGIKQFTLMERIYAAELKATQAHGKTSADLDQSWIKKIHDMKSSIGSIVRNMNDKTGTNE